MLHRAYRPLRQPIVMFRRQPAAWRSRLRLPWDIVAMILGLFYWAVFGGLLTVIGGPPHLLLAPRTGERLGRFLLHHLFR